MRLFQYDMLIFEGKNDHLDFCAFLDSVLYSGTPQVYAFSYPEFTCCHVCVDTQDSTTRRLFGLVDRVNYLTVAFYFMLLSLFS